MFPSVPGMSGVYFVGLRRMCQTNLLNNYWEGKNEFFFRYIFLSGLFFYTPAICWWVVVLRRHQSLLTPMPTVGNVGSYYRILYSGSCFN